MAINEQTIQKIIIAGDSATIVREAETLGKTLAHQLKTSQLRNVYGSIRRAANLWEVDPQKAYSEIVLLKPKLAYFNQRAKNTMGPLKDALDQAITILSRDTKPVETHFQNFVNFSEAIVAYHRANRRDQD